MDINEQILCCIFNHNENDKAIEWRKRLSPHFDTVILDSGSQPACQDEYALNLPNIFYSGLMNEAYRLCKERNCRWLVVLTSDLQISDKHTLRLLNGMKEIARSKNVGLYQPSSSWRGRSLIHSRCHFTGKMRCTNFQEGWFHMVRRDVLDQVLPIDMSINRLGWGIDLALCHFALELKLMILIDDRVRVLHPSGTGYNKKTAEAQMRQWFKTIDGYSSPRHRKPIKSEILYE